MRVGIEPRAPPGRDRSSTGLTRNARSALRPQAHKRATCLSLSLPCGRDNQDTKSDNPRRRTGCIVAFVTYLPTSGQVG